MTAIINLKKQKRITIHTDYGLAAEPCLNESSINVAEYTGIIKVL
jgi:hypothetical protein